MHVKTKPRYWTSLVRCQPWDLTYSVELLDAVAKQYGISNAEAQKRLDAETLNSEVWVNDLYQVEVTRFNLEPAKDGLEPIPMVQLNIRRRDGSCDLRDWRHFQEIKNQLVGPDCEGIELYPAEDRKVDTTNKWHIWCVADPKFRFPFGWKERDVQYDSGTVPGLKQRAL